MKAAREKQLTGQRILRKIILEARRQWDNIFKALKEKKVVSWESYISTTIQSYKSEGEIKTFPDKQKLREIITTRPTL